MDPFGGSGTTGIEALRLERNVICSDILSASVLAIKGKASAYGLMDIVTVAHEILHELAWDFSCETDTLGSNGEGGHEDLRSWYHPRTLRQLKYIWRIIEGASMGARPILELLFADVLFSCASTMRSRTSSGSVRRHHWGWIADNVKPVNPLENNAIDNFRRRVHHLTNLERNSQVLTSMSVIQQDARSLAIRDNSIDLVVTSPPYVGVIDYTRANRLLYLWRNWNLDSERMQETGARYKRGRKSLQADYLNEMSQCWHEIARVLKPGGYCAVVIGQSRRYPGTVEKAINDMSTLLDPFWGVRERSPSRRRVSDRSASDAVEYLMVWRKQE